MTNPGQLVEAVHSQGRRLTRQRQLVLEILDETQEHLDAETVYARARQRDERIGIATVYRTLAFLKEIGLVSEDPLGEDHKHFESIQDDRPHYHFTCLACGRVIEFHSPQVEALAQRLCRDQALQVESINLHIKGYCKDCRPAGSGCDQDTAANPS